MRTHNKSQTKILHWKNINGAKQSAPKSAVKVELAPLTLPCGALSYQARSLARLQSFASFPSPVWVGKRGHSKGIPVPQLPHKWLLCSFLLLSGVNFLTAAAVHLARSLLRHDHKQLFCRAPASSLAQDGQCSGEAAGQSFFPLACLLWSYVSFAAQMPSPKLRKALFSP